MRRECANHSHLATGRPWRVYDSVGGKCVEAKIELLSVIPEYRALAVKLWGTHTHTHARKEERRHVRREMYPRTESWMRKKGRIFGPRFCRSKIAAGIINERVINVNTCNGYKYNFLLFMKKILRIKDQIQVESVYFVSGVLFQGWCHYFSPK